MNRIDFQQTGGFPLETDTFDFLQNAFSSLQNLAAIAGNNCIISGCVVAGANVTDGFVVINGELLPFKGGLMQPKVVIRQTVTARTFENGSIKPVIYERFAQFGTGDTYTLFADLKRFKNSLTITEELEGKALKSVVDQLVITVQDLQKKAAPFSAGGGMVLWQKPANQIPAGWAEVVDWRGRLPMGWNPDNPYFSFQGQTGGQMTKTLSKSEMPSDLSISLSMASSDNGTGSFDQGSGNGGTNNYNLGGGGQAFSLLNPYRVVMFIEYIGGIV
jgi:hypothetical protein